jgi:DNA repair and recombination protein RAD52
MSFSAEQLASLTAPLGKSHIKSRSQAGRTLSYVEGWWAIAEANRIFGFDAWDRETVDLRQLGEAYQDAKSLYRVAYMAKVRITVRADGRATMVVRDGCGYGSGIDRDLGSAHESAIKEAETDAMKRALMTFGNPFGLALYDKEQRNVEDDTAPREPPQNKVLMPKPTTVIDEIMMTPTDDQEELFRVLTKAITDCKTLEKLAQTKEAATESLKALTDAQYADFKKVYQFKKKALETFGAAAA